MKVEYQIEKNQFKTCSYFSKFENPISNRNPIENWMTTKFFTGHLLKN